MLNTKSNLPKHTETLMLQVHNLIPIGYNTADLKCQYFLYENISVLSVLNIIESQIICSTIVEKINCKLIILEHFLFCFDYEEKWTNKY